MPPPEADQERARAALRREIRWVRLILTQMWFALGIAIFILTHSDPRPYQSIYGCTGAIIVLTSLWLLQPAIHWLTVRTHFLWLLVTDAADHLLQRYLKHRAIRRRGSLDSGPTKDISSG